MKRDQEYYILLIILVILIITGIFSITVSFPVVIGAIEEGKTHLLLLVASYAGAGIYFARRNIKKCKKNNLLTGKNRNCQAIGKITFLAIVLFCTTLHIIYLEYF